MDKKFGKIMYVGSLNKFYSPYQCFYLVLEKIAEKIITFDYRLLDLEYGKDEMNKKFLEQISEEKPDFIFIPHLVDNFYLESLMKIRTISPKSITLTYFGDDDSNYDSFSRYFKLFIDYGIVYQKQFLYRYKEEGAKNTITTQGINVDDFRPVKAERKYDVVFIGIPEYDRYVYLKYLIENGVNVRIFGRGWHVYPDLNEYYGGSLSHEEMVKTINEAKITLCFSKNLFGVPTYKGRVFETAACNSFMLVEYFSEYSKIFKVDKEIVMFKDKEELLTKVKHYLDNPLECKNIANNIYKKVKKDFNFYKDIRNFFLKHYKKKPKHQELPKSNKKIYEITKNDFKSSRDELIEKLKDINYICFNNNIIKKDPYKEYLQTYSLEKSNKPISVCNCHINKKSIGNYLYYSGYYTFHKNKEDFYKTVSINQIAVTKEFFLYNLIIFNDFFYGKKTNIFDINNTTFIEIPLLDIPKIKYVKYKNMKEYVYPKFFYKLYSLKKQNRVYSDPFIYKIIFEIIKGDYFILWLIIKAKNSPYYKEKDKELIEQTKK